MRCAVLIALACALALPLCRKAAAISTLEDTINNAPRIFRIPSTVPPNNAVHRKSIRSNSNSNSFSPDEGPKPNALPVRVPASAAPWTVAVSEGANLQEGFLCAGVLIDPNWVLTAAHCVFTVTRRWPNDSRPYVFTRTASLAAPGEKYPIEEIVVHPKYDAQTLQNDLALLRIDTGNARIAPLRLEGPPIAQQVGDIGTILGWGITTNVYNQRHREKLQLIQTAIVDNGVCFSATNFAALRNNGVFCAKSLFKYHDICFQFGGSPMVLYDPKGVLYLAGLVSWNTECPSETRRLGVFLDAQFHAPWIKSVIGRGARQ